jgi:hypothetical protein
MLHFLRPLAADATLSRTGGIDGTLKQFNVDDLLIHTDGVSSELTIIHTKSLIRRAV